MKTESVHIALDNDISVAENIINYIQMHEALFSPALFSKHDQQDLRYQFSKGSLTVDMVEMTNDVNSGVITVSYGIHFFSPCSDQDEIDTYQEKIPFKIKNHCVCLTLEQHEPWIVL